MIPVIDLGLDGRAPGALPAPTTVAAVVEACETSGFFVATGHGVPEASLGRVHDEARAFFALPDEAKAPSRAAAATSHFGWSSSQAESLARSLDEDTPPDLKESFSVPHPVPWRNRRLAEADPGEPPDVWPVAVPGLRPAVLDCYARLEALAAEVMAVFAVGLGLAPDHFAGAIDRHISAFRLLSYPAQVEDPVPGQLRAGAHTDYGSLTVLSLGDSPGGLQVHQRDGTWLDVPAIEGALVVNLGDLMVQWTNARWVSSLHRVVNPPGAERGRSRQSLAFFHQPNAAAVIEPLPTCCSTDDPPRFAPTTSWEHLQGKLDKQRLAARS